MGRNTVSFIGRDVAMVAKAFAFLFESLETCSNFQATKFPSRKLTRLTNLVMCWSLVSYSIYLPYHQLRVASYDHTEIERLIPTMIASYSASLLEARKSKCMTCSIISLVGALSCSPSLTPICCEVPSTFKVH